jgi:Coenzyme PQQ synthesis protein D (PqqD)
MFTLSKAIRSTRTPDGAVILDIHQNQIFATNLAGAAILDLMQRDLDETEISREICRIYSISLERSVADVREFIESLIELGVLLQN